jgi:hypothetical protein
MAAVHVIEKAGADLNKPLSSFVADSRKCDFCAHPPGSHSRTNATYKSLTFKCTSTGCACKVEVRKT